MTPADVRDSLHVLCVVIGDNSGASSMLAGATPGEAERMVAIARAHGVEPWLAACVPDEAAWRGLLEQRARVIAARARAVAERAEIRRIGAVLDRLDLPWVVLKGQALAEDIYPRPDLRYGVDIDVLVPPGRFAATVAALVETEWQLIDRNC